MNSSINYKFGIHSKIPPDSPLENLLLTSSKKFLKVYFESLSWIPSENPSETFYFFNPPEIP